MPINLTKNTVLFGFKPYKVVYRGNDEVKAKEITADYRSRGYKVRATGSNLMGDGFDYNVAIRK